MKVQPLKSIKHFCENLIDYAGLFPPAMLKLPAAFDNYIKYKNSEFKWMLSKFICPVKMIQELEELIIKKYSGEKDIQLSILGRGGHNIDDFTKNFLIDIKLWKDLNSKFGDSIITNTFEIKLPNEIITSHDPKKISGFIEFISSNIEKNISRPVFIFFEGHIGTEWKKNVRSLLNGIEILNVNKRNFGYKLRTGGVERYSFPSPELVSFCIKECLIGEIPLKFTAGLHHPFRHYDSEIETMMHGFVNVFAAGIIAMRHNISNFGLKEILTDENPDNFVFTENYFSWNDWKIKISDIKLARENLVISFGSCSFDEPVGDLKNLGLL